MNSNPIGIFDSGAGGLSILKEINLLMPNESTLYISDSKYAPYGPRGNKFILERSIKNTEILLSKGSKIIVVACNTATTNAIKQLRENYSVPFIGIEPAIKPASLWTNSNAIGILATKGTLSSSLFHETCKKYTKNKTVIEQDGDGIVELIESGGINSVDMKELLIKYLNPMIENNVDCIVLGCTHYYFLLPIIKKIVPKKVKIIDSGPAVALQTKVIIENQGLINSSMKGNVFNKFYTNGNKRIMAQLMNCDKSRIEVLY